MAKIVHVCLCGAMTDGLNYQENLLSKYHRKAGHNVTMIASQWMQNEYGKLVKVNNSLYRNKDDVKIIRLPALFGNVNCKFKIFPALYKTIEQERPDILFIHDCQFLNLKTLTGYVKRHHITMYIDNHADCYNGAGSWISRNILHGMIWKQYVKQAEKYVRKFYGVTPARAEFLVKMYGVSPKKCELLLMGADDVLVHQALNEENKKNLRKQTGIAENDFLIVTGGKINRFRPEILNLMKAVIDLDRAYVKLVIFGTADDRLKEEFEMLCRDKHIVYAGWIPSDETYQYLAMGNLAVFPGLHSVMWEQAAALGIPCVFRDIEGFHHTDIGGNAVFLENAGIAEQKETLERILDVPQYYDEMRKSALKEERKKFLYTRIALESIAQEKNDTCNNSLKK